MARPHGCTIKSNKICLNYQLTGNFKISVDLLVKTGHLFMRTVFTLNLLKTWNQNKNMDQIIILGKH